MGDSLSADLLGRIQKAQRTLLAPLRYDTPTAWLEAVVPHVQAVMEADHVYAALPHDGEVVLVGHNLDPQFLDTLQSAFEGVVDGRFIFDDPMPLQMHLQRRRNGAGVYHEHQLADREVIERSASYRELFAPHGIRYATGLSVPLPLGEGLLCPAFESADAPGFDPAAGQRLALLLPAFEAGIDQWRRLGPARTAFSSLLDTLSDAVALFDADGTERYRNRPLRTLLDAEPDAAALMRAVRALVDSLRPPSPALGIARREIDLRGGRYCLRLGCTPRPLFDSHGTVVVVERLSPYPSPSALQDRFDLTPREAEVALLLAEGCSNDTIADRLVISPHTARHHVQHVLRKLACDSRAGVGHVLLQNRP